MAQIMEGGGGGGKGHGKKRAKKHSTHIDMTPMVDLMSLLITFFMLTTAFSKPKIMEIVLPEEDTTNLVPESRVEIEAKRTLNILIAADDNVYYYIGKPPMAEDSIPVVLATLVKADYSKDGVRKILLSKNIQLYERVDSITQKVITGESKISEDSLQALVKIYKKEDKIGPIVMIKADKGAKYKNIVDIIDEMAICNVARYAIVEISDLESKMLEMAPK